MTQKVFAALAAATGLAIASPAHAHHSTAMFEWGTESNIEGVVESFEFTQPHTFSYILVPDGKGGQTRWALEGMSPSSLARNGWNRHTLKPGDKVKMVIYKLKDGRPGGFTARVTTPDGKELREVGPGSAARGE